jgi:hypothetical protein
MLRPPSPGLLPFCHYVTNFLASNMPQLCPLRQQLMMQHSPETPLEAELVERLAGKGRHQEFAGI